MHTKRVNLINYYKLLSLYNSHFFYIYNSSTHDFHTSLYLELYNFEIITQNMLNIPLGLHIQRYYMD